jgi:4-amino-4-deoxy-L-arabinose transferase-like glycosyltransferase
MRIPHMQRDMVRGTQLAAPAARPRPVKRRKAGGGRRRAPLPPPAFRLPPDSRFYGLVYLAAFAVYAAVAWPHTHPPYMDSFYYLDIARNLAHGQGLTEGFVWNYLGGMPPLRHPSSEYWLPGLSLLLAPALALGGGYRAAALLTAAVAALCPALAARIGHDIFGTRRHALTMAGLTLFNGLWFHDWTTPDAFVPFAALATITLLLAYKGLQGRTMKPSLSVAMAGLTAGLASLMRQEGVFLLAAIVLAAMLTPQARLRLWPRGLLGAVGLFGLVQLPWVLHNLAVLGTPYAAGGSRTLWMRSYAAFYSLHTTTLTPRAYLAWGLSHIVGVRIGAALFTVAIWAALWLVVLVPPLLIGLWRLRGRVECRPFLIYWALLALAMPLLFTATLQNGTLQHASEALVPFGSALVVTGIDVLGTFLAGLRGRHAGRLARDMSIIAVLHEAPTPSVRTPASRLARDMSIMAVALAALTSLYMTGKTFPAHGDEYTHDARVVAWLHRHNPAGTPVMVLDPPAFAYLDDRAYVVAPSDGLTAARTVARHYGVRYWALDALHAPDQEALYHRRARVPWLRWVHSVDSVQIYRVDSRQ